MAQALLNNLTSKVTEVFSASNTPENPSAENFASILDNKTLVSEETINKDIAANKEAVNDEDTSLLTEDLKLEAAIETVVDAVSEEIVAEITNEITEEISAETDTITQTDEDTTNTITDEEPTMNKELTPENPMTVLMMQSQLDYVQKQQIQSEDIPADEKLITMKNCDLNQTTKEFDVKQFELIKTADTNSKQVNVESKDTRDIKDIVREEILKELNIQSVNSENSSGTASGDLMQNQSPSEQVVKAMIHGEIKFEDVSLKVSQIEVKPAEISSTKIIEQITKQMEGMHNKSKVNIVLNPESLGKVNLQIMNTKNGLTAHFTVANEDVRAILMKSIQALRENLIAQGISVDNVTVKVNDSEFGDGEYHQDLTEQENQQGRSRGQGSKREKRDEKQFEQMMFELNNKV